MAPSKLGSRDYGPRCRPLVSAAETFDRTFKGIKLDRSLRDLQIPGEKKASKKRAQAEFVKPPARYLNKKYLGQLAARGRKHAKTWADDLKGIEERFGVQAEVIVAIWGRETSFGSYRLPHDAITAITTQAYLGRRKDYFRGELIKALKIIEEGHVPRAKMKSSWAGAMGHTQFMPSNFYDHAVDWDGDGRKDIWGSIPDSLASTAKSLKDEGWLAHTTWGYEVRKLKSIDCSLEGPKNLRPIREWVEMGYRRAFGRKFTAAQLDQEAYLLLPEGAYGPAFLMTKNFLVIKTYNMSDLYALFVGNLADRIVGAGKFETKWATSSQLRARLVMELQERLNTLGFGAGKVDGFIGTGTRSALGAFQKRHKLKLDCFPSTRVLKALREASTG